MLATPSEFKSPVIGTSVLLTNNYITRARLLSMFTNDEKSVIGENTNLVH